ncbi:MAG: glycosyltransferase family 39 protein [Patescibacteria group bacterium]|nr:glycosyltransferase family 39 protein [Patescibacteria group bacterium]
MWLPLVIIFILTRIYHLLALPPFIDEMIYIRWLQTIKITGDWLLPLKEFGWEPLGIWTASLINRFISNPLFSLRLNSVIFSILSLFMVGKLAGRSAMLFYVLSPIILFHDRLGLRGDNLVVLAGLMVIYGLKERLEVKKPNAVIWVGLGIALGLFAKTTAAALPIVVALSYLWFRPKLKPIDFIAGILSTIPFLFYWLTGTLGQVINKESTFVGEALFKNNLLQIGPWLFQYLTWPVLFLIIGGLILSWKNRLLLISWLVPLFLLAVSAKILFPRYLLPIIPFLLIYAASGFNWLKQKLPKFLRPLLIIFLLAPAWFSWQIIAQPDKAPLPEIERWQYISGWPSGYGLTELVTYLKTDSPAVLVTEDNDLIKTGLPYLWPNHPFIITQTATASAYYVSNINDQLPENLTGRLLKEFPRPENKTALRLWQLE